MGGGFEDNLLDDQVRGAIHDFALEARRILMDEARDLLEGVYGVHSNGHLDLPENLPALAIPEKREIYERLIRFLDDEVQAGLARPEAVDKLRKEIAFTHLNRLVAFKMMERRKLMREAVGRGTKSNGFLFYLADHSEDQALWQAGQSEIAYQHFLLWQAGQIAQEIKVLFDPDSLPSRLFPRAQTLQTILDLINAPEIAPAWDADETIGWIYQFFNEQEKAYVFDRLYSQKKKMRREDIPAATQLFTPRWIVRFLVENTLGKTWVEMHPDSALKEKLRYLVPNPNEEQVTDEDIEIKPVKEITLLDPACGTMHFGVLAFDLFAEMYHEEIQRAGEPGWPEAPSVESEYEIPAAILANNLYGIDIDLRAVQLAALALYLKVKNLNKDATITRHNLACADVLTLNGKRLGAFLKEAQFSRPIYERLIRALWEKLEDINQFGSLLRLEQEVETLIADERARYEREGRQSDMFVDRGDEFESAAAKEEYWAILGGQIIQAIDHFAKAQAEAGADQSFFAGEAIKGMQVLDLMLRKYDVVVTNPPYMGNRNMNNILSDFLKDQYPNGKGDLYAAFIVRCGELAEEHGRVGMITQQSFMFISSYEKMRDEILDEFAIETMAHTGARAFAEIGGEKVNTTVFVLRKELKSINRASSVGTYFRLVHNTDAESKRLTFEMIMNNLKEGRIPSNVYFLCQDRYSVIPSRIWNYWLTDNIRNLFNELDLLGSIDPAKEGINTGDNSRFVRFWWEIKPLLGFDPDASFVPFIKGAPEKKFYDRIDEAILNDLDQIQLLPGSRIFNTQYSFREAIAFLSNSSEGFRARYIVHGSRFCSTGGRALFPNKIPAFGLLGLLNSTFVEYLLFLLNPTLSITVGDVNRIPIADKDLQKVVSITNMITRIQKWFVMLEEESFEFLCPESRDLRAIFFNQARYNSYLCELNEDVVDLFHLSPEESNIIEAELAGEVLQEDYESSFSLERIGDVDKKTPINHEKLSVRWISYATGIGMGRFHPGISGKLGSAVYYLEDFSIGSLPAPDEDEFNELLGPPERFAYIDEDSGRHVFPVEVELSLRDLVIQDGIAVLGEGHPRDLPALVEKALVLMLGEADARDVIREATGDPSSASLRKFLERDFFTKWHLKWYKKRPVYWPIQSPNRGYGFVIFHEKITKDTFFTIQRKPFLESKINAVTFHLEEIEDLLRSAQGAKRKSLEKQLDQTRKLADELAEFSQTLERITLGSDGLPGYTPEENWIDDGVILRMAPLWEVIPIWKSEPKKYWERLESGLYDWSHIAMHYWPERVREKCETDKSYAIAHGYEYLYEGR